MMPWAGKRQSAEKRAPTENRAPAESSRRDPAMRTESANTTPPDQADELRRATPRPAQPGPAQPRPVPPRRVTPPPAQSRRIPVPPRRPEQASAPPVKPPVLADGRTLIIKRRQAGPPDQPHPDPVETASVLREMSENGAIVRSRRQRRRQRKEEHKAAVKAREDAERARKEAEKLAKKRAKKRAKLARKSKGDVAADEEPLPDPASIELPDVPRKPGRKERKALKLLDAIGAVEGEEALQIHEGRSRLRAATLVITTYRIAVIGRGARRRVLGWIPLEEIERIKRVWRGAATLHIEGSFERMSFQFAASGALTTTTEAVRTAVKEARASGTARHSADVIQAWCERTSEVWESGANRFRLRIRKHPAATLVALASLVPAAYLLSSRL